MSPAVALGLLIAYLMLSVEIYLATYAVGDFKISYYKMGPTELRILLSIGNLAVLWKSTVHLFGRAHRLFDVAGTLGISGMLLIMVISAVRNAIRLYREEPIPGSASRCRLRNSLPSLSSNACPSCPDTLGGPKRVRNSESNPAVSQTARKGWGRTGQPIASAFQRRRARTNSPGAEALGNAARDSPCGTNRIRISDRVIGVILNHWYRSLPCSSGVAAIPAIVLAPPPRPFPPFVANKALRHSTLAPPVALAWPLGDAWVALGPPKGHPRPKPNQAEGRDLFKVARRSNRRATNCHRERPA